MGLAFARLHRAFHAHVERAGLLLDTRDMIQRVLRDVEAEGVELAADKLLGAHRAYLDEYVAVRRGQIAPKCAWY